MIVRLNKGKTYYFNSCISRVILKLLLFHINKHNFILSFQAVSKYIMCNNLLLATISMTIIPQTKVFRGKIRYTFWVWFNFIKCKRDEFIITRPDWKYLTVTLLSSVGFFLLEGRGNLCYSQLFYIWPRSLHTTGLEVSSANREKLWHRRGTALCENSR